MFLHIKTIGLIGILGLFGLIAGLLIFFLLNPHWSSPADSAKELEILSGMSLGEISDNLLVNGLVRSRSVFKIYALLIGQAHRFKPGRYFLSANASIPELVGILTRGPKEVSVVIPPGLTLKEIDDRLSSSTVIRQGELANFDAKILKQKYSWLPTDENGSINLEGFLLPDTYNFFAGSEASLVVGKFLDNFAFKALPNFENYNSILETVNLASILEKETPDYNERQIAAGVLIKRLTVGMPLQVDASLLYAKCSARFLNCPLLREEDYKIDSPYNTYLRVGLPEAPISNPSVDAIKAAMNPQKSDYWYYLSDPETGKTIFSKILDEHNKNRATYLLNK